MHNGWLQVREASLRSWLNFLQPSLHLESFLQLLLHGCSLDTIQSHPHQGNPIFLSSLSLWPVVLREENFHCDMWSILE